MIPFWSSTAVPLQHALYSLMAEAKEFCWTTWYSPGAAPALTLEDRREIVAAETRGRVVEEDEKRMVWDFLALVCEFEKLEESFL